MLFVPSRHVGCAVPRLASDTKEACRPDGRTEAILALVPEQDDVEVIREAFRRWNERDIEYWIRHAHPDVQIWSKYASLDEGGGPYRGHAGMREWRAEIDRNFELHEVFVDDVRNIGDKVLVLGGVHFRGDASGIEMRHPFAWVCEMRNGALARMFFYSSHADALEAVDLAK